MHLTVEWKRNADLHFIGRFIYSTILVFYISGVKWMEGTYAVSIYDSRHRTCMLIQGPFI